MKINTFFFIILIINITYQHGIHTIENDIKPNSFELFIYEKIKKYSKLNQAYIGAFIISSAPIPIYILI